MHAAAHITFTQQIGSSFLKEKTKDTISVSSCLNILTNLTQQYRCRYLLTNDDRKTAINPGSKIKPTTNIPLTKIQVKTLMFQLECGVMG